MITSYHWLMTVPRRFTSQTSADRWLETTFADWLASLTIDEREALAIYKGDGYHEVNAALRHGTPYDQVADLIESPSTAQSRSSHYRSRSSCIEASQVLSSPRSSSFSAALKAATRRTGPQPAARNGSRLPAKRRH
jgi:hypothetical protein